MGRLLKLIYTVQYTYCIYTVQYIYCIYTVGYIVADVSRLWQMPHSLLDVSSYK